MKKIILQPKKEHFVKRRHPWIFSGAIKQIDPETVEGDTVEVLNPRGDLLAVGHYQEGSIAVRVLAFSKTEINQKFWDDTIANAVNYRESLNLASSHTNCYRLIHGAGDSLPGLVIDIYGEVAVIQCHSIGMYRELEEISTALKNSLPTLKAIFNKSKATLPRRFAEPLKDGFLFGDTPIVKVMENGLNFKVDFTEGQKTGFFLDQRDNRQLLSQYSSGKRILNTFCYSGGFSVYALHAGASMVHSVDLSAKAIGWTNENVELNNPTGTHEAYASDVLDFLKNSESYDVVIVDPPAFAKKPSKRHQAVQGYKRLNALAMEKVVPGGMLFTFSCSQVVDRQLFYDTIVAAAIEVGRSVKVMHHLSQPPDHPVNLFHPEGAYLKGLVLRID